MTRRVPGLVTRDGLNCARCGGPLRLYKDGSRRCPPCRTEQRKEERERAANRRSRAFTTAREVEAILEQDDEELTEENLRTLIEAGEHVDFGDDYVLAHRYGAPWVRVTDEERREATALWRTGSARKILERSGVSGNRFAKMVGVTPGSVAAWLRDGKAPKQGDKDGLAARALLDLKLGNEDQDALLVAHGRETTRHAELTFYCAARDLARPYEHCTGCRRYRQQQLRQY